MKSEDNHSLRHLFTWSLLALIAGSLWNLSRYIPSAALAGLLVLPVAALSQDNAWKRLAVGMAYYLPATASIVPSYGAFFHSHHFGLPGIAVWLAASFLLAAPWALARGPWSTLVAAVLSGILGPLSIWPVAGLLFPGMGLVGLIGMVILLYAAGEVAASERGLLKSYAKVADASFWVLVGSIVLSNVFHFAANTPEPPASWIAVDTVGLKQTGGDVFASLETAQQVIRAGRSVSEARVLVFPEAVLNDMLPGTVGLVSSAVPKGQTWLVGAEDGVHDGVWAFTRGKPPVIVAASTIPMPLSMWRPWSARSYKPTWVKQTFELAGQKVWSAVCYEQVVPWTWVEALWQSPSLILLQSNAWWASPGNPAPFIQSTQASGWLRLLGIPYLVARNTAL